MIRGLVFLLITLAGSHLCPIAAGPAEQAAAWRALLRDVSASLHPRDQSPRRWICEHEQALAGLELTGAAPSSLQALVAACTDPAVELVVFGEMHGLQLEERALILHALSRGAQDRPRLLVHEFILREWGPWLEAVNQRLPGRQAFGRQLEALAVEQMRRVVADYQCERHPALAQHYLREIRIRIAPLAQLLWHAARAGWELHPGGSAAGWTEMVARGAAATTGQGDRFDYRGYQERRDDRMLQVCSSLAAGEGNPLVVLMAGERHALGPGRVAARWPGRPPRVILCWAPLVQLELLASGGSFRRNDGRTYRLNRTTWFVALPYGAPLKFPEELASPLP